MRMYCASSIQKMSSSDEVMFGLIVVLDIILIAALAIAAGIFALLYYKYYYKCLPTKGKYVNMELFHYS